MKKALLTLLALLISVPCFAGYSMEGEQIKETKTIVSDVSVSELRRRIKYFKRVKEDAIEQIKQARDAIAEINKDLGLNISEEDVKSE